VDNDGDGWVECGQGHRHWGRLGAAGLLIRDRSESPGRVLLQHRAAWSHHGDTWGLPGGARNSHESPVEAALREATEEAGVPPELVRPEGTVTDDHGGWSYTSVVAEPVGPLQPRPTGAESTDVRWVPVAEVGGLPLHPGFADTWPRLRNAPAGLALIVDGANVVGARGGGDGWWRDRAGAARRLREALLPLAAAGFPAADLPARVGGGPDDVDLLLPRVLLVVEGVARVVADDPPTAVAALAAPGSGDDAIVATAAATAAAGRRVLVVTADRGLAARLAAIGIGRVGPRWLLDRVDGPGSPRNRYIGRAARNARS
jgi:8-oxo-dGTP pyrophosphatase MutT (NUDIX family)